jgi:hypothetical protein
VEQKVKISRTEQKSKQQKFLYSLLAFFAHNKRVTNFPYQSNLDIVRSKRPKNFRIKSRSILKVFLLKRLKNFRTKSRFALYRGSAVPFYFSGQLSKFKYYFTFPDNCPNLKLFYPSGQLPNSFFNHTCATFLHSHLSFIAFSQLIQGLDNIQQKKTNINFSSFN